MGVSIDLPFRGGLRQHLILLVLATLVPMLLWAGGLMLWNSVQERRAIERGLAETARALAIAVDQELRLAIETLNTAGMARALEDRDYPRFDTFLRDLVESHPSWHYATLVAADGRQIDNTARPFGSVLPHMDDLGDAAFAQAFRRALATGRPAVSDLYVGKVSARQLIGVAVPVFDADDRVWSVLMAALLPERLAELLRLQQGPPGWLAVVADSRQTIVARSILHEKFIGKPSLEWFREAVKGRDHGIVSGPSLHGPTFTIAFQRSPLSDWIISFAAPRSAFTATLKESLAVTMGFGLVLMTGSILLALAVARRILEPIQALTIATRPFLPVPASGRPQYAIAELDALHRALDGLAASLARSRARFQKVFAVAPVMLFVCDAECRLTEVNESWLKALGYPRDEVLGRSVFDFYAPGSREHGLAVVWPHFLKVGVIDDMPAQYLTKAGEVRDVLVSLRAETDATGMRTIGAIRDITEMRRGQKALDRAVSEAAKANDAKSRFLAAASHDLRQPLQALNLYLSVLRGRESEGPVITAIGQCVASLTGLLNDMLDVSRLDAGVITPKVAEVPVAQLLDQVAVAWRIQAEAKGLRLDIVPSARVVCTDPALIERVLSNLVANAVRYTEGGRVLVGCRRDGPDHVRIEVWDTGIGIPEDKLGDIFEEFRQLGNPERRRDRGTGLGLAIVQRIVTLLGHRLSVRSWPGRGSVFAVTVPTVVAGALPEPVQAEVAPTGRRRILVVDDEAHVCAALAMALRDMGHHVATAGSVDEALARLGELRPDLVIADFRLGGEQTGIEVVRAVRQSMGDEVPAVVLTGDTDPATIRRIVGAGLHLLHKPLQIEALKTFLRQVA